MTTLIAKLRSLWRAESGVAAVEFALIAPTLMVMFFGTYEAANLIRVKMKFDSAAPAIASLISLQTADSGTLTSDFCTGADDMMAPFSSSGLAVQISSVTNYSGTSKVDWTANCGTVSNAKSATTLASGLLPDSGDSVIVVQTSYTYQAPIHLVLGTSYTMTNVGYARPRNDKTITYSP